MRHLRIYWAGDMFDYKHLVGNQMLVDALAAQTGWTIRLPQRLTPSKPTNKAIRDQDFLEVVQCDAIVAHFDGTDLDSGTVAEFMYAKFLDKPSVCFRTDFRGAGDQVKGDPWNLMLSNYPRNVNVNVHGLHLLQDHGHDLESYLSDLALKVQIGVEQAIELENGEGVHLYER